MSLRSLLILVKRDYAVQYSGAVLGISWAAFQSFAQIGIFLLASSLLIRNEKSGAAASASAESVAYSLTGLIFWIPIQDMILKGNSILSENRNLLKKSGIKLEYFLMIPMVQMVIQSLLIGIPAFIFLSFYSEISLLMIPAAFSVFLFTAVTVYPFVQYLSLSNVLLKDISAAVRIFLQAVFWSLPVLYVPSGSFQKIALLHPFHFPLSLFRYFLTKESFPEIYSVLSFSFFCIISVLVFFLSGLKYKKSIMDHL